MTIQLWVITIASVIGICDTLYLIYHAITGKPVACWFFPDEWCVKVQQSSYSKTAGIPNPVLGFGMYLALLALTWLYLGGNVPFVWIQTIIAIGAAFSLYFTYIQAFVLRAFCTWCVLSALNFLAMFLAAFVL